MNLSKYLTILTNLWKIALKRPLIHNLIGRTGKDFIVYLKRQVLVIAAKLGELIVLVLYLFCLAYFWRRYWRISWSIWISGQVIFIFVEFF